MPASGTTATMPGPDTVWKQEGSGPLSVDHPVSLTYDNGQGLIFHRTIAVDDHYLFTIKDEVQNKGSNPVTLFPYALISRHGAPKVLGYYILHEGLVGVMGDQGEQTETYKKMDEKKVRKLGRDQRLARLYRQIFRRDPPPRYRRQGEGALLLRRRQRHQDLSDRLSARGADHCAGRNRLRRRRLFAGAKEVSVVGINFLGGIYGGYNAALGLNHFDLLIDWGWFYFITKPMFLALDYFFHLVGNFGIAILIVTVIVKLLFFPLANKSYASMAKMKAVQPQMAMIKERYADDKVKQQQAMMELYKKEQINPIAGCLPIAIQIPVFFSLYKVLFITIEMRHAPFYGWIHDLSARTRPIFSPLADHSVRSDDHSDGRLLPASGLLAGDHGRDHVGADEAQPGAAGSDPADDLQLDAADLHLHAGEIPGRPRDLLGLEQLALGGAAERDHAPERRQDSAVG